MDFTVYHQNTVELLQMLGNPTEILFKMLRCQYLYLHHQKITKFISAFQSWGQVARVFWGGFDVKVGLGCTNCYGRAPAQVDAVFINS